MNWMGAYVMFVVSALTESVRTEGKCNWERVSMDREWENAEWTEVVGGEDVLLP